MSDIQRVPGFVLRDYWLSGQISDKEYRAETDRRALKSQQGTDALAILKRLINVPAFMTTQFGDGRPVTSIKFDDNEGAWAFMNALGDARKMADSVVSPEPAP